MQVYGPAQLHGPQAIGAPHITRTAQTSSSPFVETSSIQDEVHISDAAQAASQSSSTGPTQGIRQDRVQAIRAQIAAGTYETPGKLDVAVSRLLDTIG